MRVMVNGEERELHKEATIVDLLKEIGLAETLVAVECNKEIVPRAQHATTALQDGDRVEVVHFVGGG